MPTSPASYPVRSLDTLLTQPIPAPRALIGPVIEGSMGMLYARRGIGKTLLAMELALGLAGGDSRLLAPESHWPQWRASAPCPVLYVAGEMSLHTFQARVRAQLAGRPAPATLSLLSSADLIARGGAPLLLNSPACREQIACTVKSTGARLLILDNLDTLMIGAGDEEAYQPIGQWLTSLSFTGLASLSVHHAGKSGDQRGTSIRENPLDYVLRLEPLDDTSDRIAFRVTFTKARFIDKLLARSFEAEFLPNERPHALWRFTSSHESRLLQLIDIVSAVGAFRYHDVAQEMGIGVSRVYKLRSKAIERGLWEPQWDKGRHKKKELAPVEPPLASGPPTPQQGKEGKVIITI